MGNYSNSLFMLFCRYKMYDFLTPGQVMDVYVSTASTPANFWCQPAKCSNDDLPLLMDKIQDFYSSPKSSSQHRLVDPQIGRPCVAQFSDDKVWYRAEVTSFDDDVVNVCFVDYGNTETIPMSEIRPITAELVELPQQAVCCSLSGIEATGGDEYDKASSIRFQELVTYDDSKLFTMAIETVKDGHFQVNLKDSNMDIAQVLLGGGYAKQVSLRCLYDCITASVIIIV